MLECNSLSYEGTYLFSDNNPLIYNPNLNFSKTLASDGVLTVYIDKSCKPRKFIKKIVRKTDELLNIKFNFVKTSQEAEIYFTTAQTIWNNPKILGLAEPLVAQNQWKVTIKQNIYGYTRWAYIHEFGHTLGMEHPFDKIDDDYWENTTTNDTVMSYNYASPTRVGKGIMKGWFFRQADKDAITGVWN